MRIIFEVSLRANGFEPQTERNNMRLKSVGSQYRTHHGCESSVPMGMPSKEELISEIIRNFKDDGVSVVKFVNMILYKGFCDRALEIRIEYLGLDFGIGYLLSDGWHEEKTPAVVFAPAIIARIKTMANIPELCETKQNGVIQVTINGQPYDFNVSYSKSFNGESAVLYSTNKDAQMNNQDEQVKTTFEFKCPQCGHVVEAEESVRGEVVECPYCGKGIVVPKN